MKYRHWLFLALAATSVVGLRAAPADDDDEDFSDIGFYANSKNKVTFGFRLTQGAKVHFGRVGAVSAPAIESTADGAQYPNGAATTYTYSNGVVVGDSLRANEVKYNADGTPVVENGKYVQTSTQGGRYTTNSGPQYDNNGNIIVGGDGQPLIVTTGSYVSYTPNQVRDYAFENGEGQLLADGSGIVFSQYSASSKGTGLEGEQNFSAGIELNIGRQIGRFFGGKMDVTVVGGVSLNDISSKQAADVTGTLHVIRDTFYFVNGGTLSPANITGSYTAPTFLDYTDEQGNVHIGADENSPQLAAKPGAPREEKDIGDITVSGVWKVKGAYFAGRVGSEIRTMFSKNFGVSLGAGVAGAYAATRFTAIEQFTVEGVSTPIGVTEFSDEGKFLPGYYANVDASWALNERTGVYAGVGYESFEEYDQVAGGRSAKVEIGNMPTVRGGISIKF